MKSDTGAGLLHERIAPPPTGMEVGNRQPQVLVVDDNRDCLMLVCELLAAQGYRTIAAASGAEALKCLACTSVDAVLLDA